jgi:restriction system protein
MQLVLDRIAAAMSGQLRDVDHLPLSSDPKRPRWKNSAQWCRNTMVEDGLLKNDSPWGVWEISEAGARYLARHETAQIDKGNPL